MRMFFCCFGLFYSYAGVIDTEVIKPSQPPTLERVLADGIPDWMGSTARFSRYDQTD